MRRLNQSLNQSLISASIGSALRFHIRQSPTKQTEVQMLNCYKFVKIKTVRQELLSHLWFLVVKIRQIFLNLWRKSSKMTKSFIFYQFYRTESVLCLKVDSCLKGKGLPSDMDHVKGTSVRIKVKFIFS